MKTAHLTSLKIANKSETIAAFIKNTQAFFDNETRQKMEEESAIKERGKIQKELASIDNDSASKFNMDARNRSPYERSLERQQRYKELCVSLVKICSET